ncbi:MAG: glycosyl hydrolase 53 family protein [Paludibacteraceae bacterium]|nr:glycosyl hydrolase 53 family protein [Paludibacteraceae bacterium]
MKHTFTLIAALSIITAALAFDNATEGNKYWGDNCEIYGLADGSVSVSAFELGAEGQTEITLPSQVHATYNDATGDNSFDKNYQVTQVGYNQWDFWVTYWSDKSYNRLPSITSMTLSEGITSINAKFSATSLKTLVLPSTLTAISCAEAFKEATALTSIVCKATTPPSLAADVFAESIITGKTCIVTVPKGSLSAYAGSNWAAFYNNGLIKEDNSDDQTPDTPDTPQGDNCYNKLRGADISRLTYIEAHGGKYYDADGKLYTDPLDLLQAKGINCARIRLFNNPGTSVTYYENNTAYTQRMPENPAAGRPQGGYQGEQDILNLAQRAVKHKMKIQLTFHLSDFWSDATKQIIPVTWSNVSTTEVLGDSVYNYVYNFLQKMNNQQTPPDYVSIGNEINSGILFGFLDLKNSSNNDVKSYGGRDNANFKYLLARGCAAVRAACPNAKIVMHLNNADQNHINNYKSFMNKVGDLDFDVIGGSYYPAYSNAKPESMSTWASQMKSLYNKEVLVMETGYSWTQYKPSGRNGGNYEGQLGMNGSIYNEASESGQVAFMKDLQEKIDADDNNLGYIYWDPMFIDFQVNGTWAKVCWAEKYSGGWWEDGNPISNTTWFNYEGKALPVLDQIASTAVICPKDDDEDTSDNNIEALPNIEIVDGKVISEETVRIFTIDGRDITHLNGSLLRGIYIIISNNGKAQKIMY